MTPNPEADFIDRRRGFIGFHSAEALIRRGTTLSIVGDLDDYCARSGNP